MMAVASVPGRRSVVSGNPLSFLCSRELGPENSQLGHLLLRKRISVANNLYRRDLRSHYGCVNAIEFSRGGGEWIISGGDDRRVLLWNVQQALSYIGQPVPMKGEHISNIFCLAFDQHNNKIFSGGNDEQVIVHDVATGTTVDVFRHEDAVYGLSVDPNNENVFASACDDGRVLIYDIREAASSEPFCLANYTSSMHAVMYNPMEPRLLATANAREGVGLWDIRNPKTCCLRYGGSYVQQSSMSVRISNLGDRVIALRRRLPPVLYQTHKPDPICEFDHSGYYNSCTMKSCSFAGENDEYVLSGSDDFNLYMWKVPEDLSHRHYLREAHMVLKGHRSIVNQVRYNPTDNLIISSGVEKIVKMWSPFPMPNSSGDLEKSNTSDLSDRPVYTPEEYISLVLRSGHIMSHDYSHQSTDEDPRMMAFFDSLVQGEMDMSSDDLSSNEEELYERIVQVTRSELENTVQDVPEDLSSVNSGDESDYSPFTLAFASVMAAQTSDGGGHSRLLDAQEVSQSGGEEDSETNDQRQGNRKSIAEIIAQNRKEVLKAIETKQKTVNLKKNCSKIRTSSSSDSDSDEEKPSVKRSRTLENVNETESVPPEKQKMKSHLKRLRDLRNKALYSDSEGSDTGVPASKRACQDSESSATEPEAPCSETNINNSFTKDSGGPGLGPYLHETEIGNCSKVGNMSEKSNSQSSVSETGISINGEHQSDSINKGSSKIRNDKKVNKETTCVEDSQPSTSKCDSESFNGNNKDKSRKRMRTNSNNHGVEESEVSCEQTNEENAENNEPLWTEFKRFKNRLERARRYYRKHSSSQPSSDDD